MTLLLIILAIMALLAVSLQRTYSRYSLKELKRQAREGDDLAEALVKAVSYGYSLRAILWLLVGVTSAGFFVLVSQQAPLWFALTSSALLVWLGFVWLPAARVSFVSEKIASWLAPVFAKLLQYVHPLLDWVLRLVRRFHKVHIHTGLYDKYDLIELLERQEVQADNRVEKTELDIARHALQFGDITVGEKMIPRRKVKMVSASETLGPITMDELHASGHSRFPVYDGKQDNIVGTLFLHDLVRVKAGGNAKTHMRTEAYYLHEDQTLHDALQAVLKTHRHLFVVVNSFEEYVGIITSEDILEAIVGRPIIDEFDNYEDLRAVAARDAVEEHQEHIEKDKEVEKIEPEPVQSEEHEEEVESSPNSAEPEEDIETVEIDNTK